jgi:hypothetical protein
VVVDTRLDLEEEVRSVGEDKASQAEVRSLEEVQYTRLDRLEEGAEDSSRHRAEARRNRLGPVAWADLEVRRKVGAGLEEVRR